MRYAIAVAEDRSFTRAAERCFVVQSALSHQIKALEHDIGVQLFFRTSRRVEVTQAGEAFVAAARASLELAERAIVDAAAASGEVRGSLTVGIIPTVTTVDVAQVVARFHDLYPGVALTVRSLGSDASMQLIHDGRLDVAFLGLPSATEPAGVAARPLGHGRLVAVVPASHALGERKSVVLADLAPEPFIDFPEESLGGAPATRRSGRPGCVVGWRSRCRRLT